jgi:hypothetical protein
LQEYRDAGLLFRIIRSCVHEHTDASHALRLLRARRERPRHCRAAEQRDESAPFQLIEFPRFNISGSLAMFDATRLASSIVICFASMASASVERP